MPHSENASSLVLQDMHHVAVPCRDAERSRRFYCQVLGCCELPRPPFDFPGAWLHAGNVQIHLIQTPEDPPFAQTPIQSRTLHLAFRVSNLTSARDILEQHQVPCVERVNAGGIPQLFFQDPDGTNIELTVTTAPEYGYQQSPAG